MIGLKRHTVRLADHNVLWADIADTACADIRRIASQLIVDVQHVGSMAVPGLPAKPIVDIAIAVSDQDHIEGLIDKMTKMAYIYRGEGRDSGGHLFIFESVPDVRAIHAHVVAHKGFQWENYLAFRDALRQDHAIRKEYAELKHRFCAQYPNSRKEYTAAKHDFIRGVLKAEGRKHGVSGS